MPFYKFQVCDPITAIEGHAHDGAALSDDIDAMLFAAGIIQRFFQEHRKVPRNWAVRITQDSRGVSVLPFELGLKVLVRPYWVRDLAFEVPEACAMA